MSAHHPRHLQWAGLFVIEAENKSLSVSTQITSAVPPGHWDKQIHLYRQSLYWNDWGKTSVGNIKALENITSSKSRETYILFLKESAVEVAEKVKTHLHLQSVRWQMSSGGQHTHPKVREGTEEFKWPTHTHNSPANKLILYCISRSTVRNMRDHGSKWEPLQFKGTEMHYPSCTTSRTLFSTARDQSGLH